VHVPYAPAAEAYARFARHPVVDDFAAQRDEIVRDVRARVAAGEDVPVVLQEQWTDLYDAALWTLDAALAGLPALLAGTGHGDDTVVVVTVDHGERFFERGRFGHGGRLDEPVLRVPLIVAGAGIAKDRRIPAVVRSVDLYPTLAEIAGVDTTLPLQGLNLAPVLRGAAGTPPPATAYATQGKTHVLRDGQYKLHVRAGGAALHHLPSDPGERTDLRARHPDVVRRMHGALERWIAESRRLAAEREDTTERELTPEVVEQLRALGYVS
jgi:arylsulfatase A-like enzyme